MHRVKPDDDVPGSVNSYEGLPFHFDLMAPPKYMGVNQAKHKYEDFICREFLLYCKQSPRQGMGGATTFVDCNAVALAIDGDTRELWRETVLVYGTELTDTGGDNNNKETYFGSKGNTYTYPLVQRCPWTGKEVLRWWQSWSLKNHPGSVQHNWWKIKSYPSEDQLSSADLEREIQKIALDEKFFFAHEYEAGDQVFVNNYTMIHGRNGFSRDRELWRLQAIPPSNNLPPYFLK